jgi:uncharacterized protein involved in exopolysaccharide biosynthesis
MHAFSLESDVGERAESARMTAFDHDEQFENEVDVRALYVRLARRPWWIVASVAVFAAAFGAAAFLMPPVYRATTVLAPSIADRGGDVVGFASGALGGLASAAGLGLGPRDAETEEALAVLRSREFTENFITNKNLMPEFFPRKWNIATGMWQGPPERRPTLAKAYKYFDQKIRAIVQDKKTGLVLVQIDWTNREEAAAWANELVQLLNKEMRARATAKADASMHFLNRELETTSTIEGRAAISRLIESQVKQRMLANVTQDYSFRVVDKAISSDGDEPVKPQKLLLLTVGPLLGLIVGVMFVLLFGSRSSNKKITA